MRDYGKVYSRIWESADFRALTEDGRTLVLYLLTCQHGTIAGVFRVPDGYACEDLQWTSERVSEGFGDLLRKGFAARCETTKWVWVTKFLEWNPPENPNQCKAARKIALGVPDQCVWKRAFMRACGPLVGIDPPVDNPPPANPSETVPQPVTVTVAVTGAGAVPPSVGAPPNGSPTPPPAPPAPAAKAAATKGSRLDADWKLPKAWGDWALAEFPQWDAAKVRREGESFRDHWVAKTGKDATKLDWQATWRNWCRSSIAHKDDPKPTPGAQGSAAPDAAATARMLASRDSGASKPPAEVVAKLALLSPQRRPA